MPNAFYILLAWYLPYVQEIYEKQNISINLNSYVHSMYVIKNLCHPEVRYK